MRAVSRRGLVEEIVLLRDRVADWSAYPFSLPAIRGLSTLRLDPSVTFFVGENGSGKSTLVEALAVAAGMNPEGGGKHFTFATRPSHSELHTCVRLSRSVRRVRTNYFLRAESFFNVATELDAMGGDALGPLTDPAPIWSGRVLRPR
jgi:predicted ATPase